MRCVTIQVTNPESEHDFMLLCIDGMIFEQTDELWSSVKNDGKAFNKKQQEKHPGNFAFSLRFVGNKENY